jgi:hypothetical protein
MLLGQRFGGMCTAVSIGVIADWQGLRAAVTIVCGIAFGLLFIGLRSGRSEQPALRGDGEPAGASRNGLTTAWMAKVIRPAPTSTRAPSGQLPRCGATNSALAIDTGYTQATSMNRRVHHGRFGCTCAPASNHSSTPTVRCTRDRDHEPLGLAPSAPRVRPTAPTGAAAGRR